MKRSLVGTSPEHWDGTQGPRGTTSLISCPEVGTAVMAPQSPPYPVPSCSLPGATVPSQGSRYERSGAALP